jgi:photosystem II stability/assembly factor-like uncharacterized protein
MHHRPRRNLRVLPAVLLAAWLAASGAAAQTWSGGPPYGGDVRALAQSPGDPDRLFAATAGGLFRSDDGGAHWTRTLGASPSGPGRFVAMAASDTLPGRLYVADASGRIYRSDDDGASIASVYRLTTVPDDLTGLFAVPGSGGQLYATTYQSGLWYSADAGASFARADAGMDPGSRISKLAISSAPGVMIAFTEAYGDPFYYSLTGADGWMPVRSLSGAVTAAAAQGFASYVATSAFSGGTNLHVSYSVGSSWLDLPPGCAYIQGILLDAGGENPEWLGCRYGGLVRYSPNVPFTSPPGPDGEPAAIRQVLRDRTDPARLWAASENAGVFASTDGGLTWNATNEGLAASSFRSVAVDPRRPQRLFAGYINESTGSPHPGVLVSDDGGAHWTSSDAYRLTDMLRSIAVDPTTAGEASGTVLYAAGSGRSGLYKSLDGGLHWIALFGDGSDLMYPFFRELVLDPRSCANPPPSGVCRSGPLQTFYAVGGLDDALRVVRVDQGGAALMRLGGGLPAPLDTPAAWEAADAISIALDPHDSRRIYVGTYLRYTPRVAPAAPPQIDNGVFRSDDGGATWQAVNEGLPHHAGSANTAFDIYALAAHPTRSGTLWAVGSFDAGAHGSQVFRSDDAGASWQAQLASDCDLRRLLVDPTAPDIVYASGRQMAQGPGCVLRSEDGGAHWIRVDAALPATAVMALAQVPNEHGHLLAGTNTGVWHLRDATNRLFDSGFD